MQSAKRLLVVDDDVDFADSLTDLLSAEGFDVSVAYDGGTAVDMSRAEQFDLAFIDVQMPGRNGVESLGEIRRLHPDAMVVMMTGYSVPELLNRAADSGAAAILTKPLDFARLHQLIERTPRLPKVLLVDDDEDYVESLRAELEARGYAVAVAQSGEEAVARARAHTPDLLLLDIRLGGMSGAQALAELEALGVEVPTIIVSGYVDEERATLERLSGVPPDRVVAKPIDGRQLADLLKQVAGIF